MEDAANSERATSVAAFNIAPTEISFECRISAMTSIPFYPTSGGPFLSLQLLGTKVGKIKELFFYFIASNLYV